MEICNKQKMENKDCHRSITLMAVSEVDSRSNSAMPIGAIKSFHKLLVLITL